MDQLLREPGRGGRVLPDGTTLRSVPKETSHQCQLEDAWDEHGSSIYVLACALLGDEAAATQAVTLGMIDFAGSSASVATQDCRRAIARHVYLRSQDLLGDPGMRQDLPPAMVWLARLAPLQRACLALCCFGGHTHREAALLLDVPAPTVAELLTSALREIAEPTPAA